jgi:DNA-binding helix-hairpin-helix protein with protein kinase domain
MIVIIFLCSATLVFAADQTGNPKQKTKRDRSCQTDLTGKTVQNLLVAGQTQSRQPKRLKKGAPGNSDLIDAADGKLLAAKQTRNADRKQPDRDRDRSCQPDLTGNTDQNLQAGDRKRERKRDNSCQG